MFYKLFYLPRDSRVYSMKTYFKLKKKSRSPGAGFRSKL